MYICIYIYIVIFSGNNFHARDICLLPVVPDKNIVAFNYDEAGGLPTGDQFKADIARRVVSSNTKSIKESEISYSDLADILLENRIISRRDKKYVMDGPCGFTANDRLDNLIQLMIATITEDKDFKLILDTFLKLDSLRTDKLVNKLLSSYWSQYKK